MMMMRMIPEVYAQETPRNERILSLLSAVLLRDYHYGHRDNMFHAAIQNKHEFVHTRVS